MAKIIECDCCGKKMKVGSGHYYYEVNFTHTDGNAYITSSWGDISDSFDLCEDCAKKVQMTIFEKENNNGCSNNNNM